MEYRLIGPLAAYIDRVGAEELNFRRYMIKEWRGNYYKQSVLITISQSNEITCSNEDYAPTKAEADAIKAALDAVNFPKSVNAPPAKLRLLKETIADLPHADPEPKLFEFYDQERGDIIMVQQRIDRADGSKFFKPWSFWSDGQWRAMEPYGALPFWKPKASTNKSRIMVHEGAKVAKHLNELLADPERKARHPWGAYLDDYEHWGMIGGALSPHRADYDELRKRNPVELVYVCDNDMAGKDALPAISKCWKRQIKGVFFDDRWKPGFDLADELPSAFYTDGIYNGPQLQELVFSATWATDMVVSAGGKKGGRQTAVIRTDFAEEWFHCTRPEAYIHRDTPHVILDEKSFNNHIRPFSDVDDTARILKKHKSSKTGQLAFSPAISSGFKAGRDDLNFINTHTPSRIKSIEGSAQPFVDFMAHLVPDEAERIELLRWCATLVHRPDLKMLYGVLLISEMQGVGKGTLGEKILLPLVGRHNVSIPNESDIVESNFNYWAAHKRMALVHEIYAGHSSKAYNKLKSIITDHYITVNKKYMAGYEIENWLHIYACSNSLRAIQLSIDDRRWFVPKVTEIQQPPEYWQRLAKWLNEQRGLEITMHYLHQFLEDHRPVFPGQNAPMTRAKREVIEEGYSPGQAIVAQFLRTAAEKLNGDKVVILDSELQQLIKDQIYEGRHNDRLERTSTLRKVASSVGWYVSDDYARVEAWGTRSSRVKIITNDAALARTPAAEIAAMQDVQRLPVAERARAWLAL